MSNFVASFFLRKFFGLTVKSTFPPHSFGIYRSCWKDYIYIYNYKYTTESKQTLVNTEKKGVFWWSFNPGFMCPKKRVKATCHIF